MTHYTATLSAFAILLLLATSPTALTKEYGDIYMDSKRESMQKANVKAVVFPHWFHRIRFKCKVCHEDIFVMKKGANNISMRRIMDGETCGTCHNGLIAWEPLYCDKCHTAEFEPVTKTETSKKQE